MPSRLKGIETRLRLHFVRYLIHFGYTFPFEGNGNTSRVHVLGTIRTPLDTPSRLKGMETLAEYPIADFLDILWIHLPV